MSLYKAVKRIGKELKRKKIEELKELIKSNKYIIISPIFKIKGKDLQEFRKILRKFNIKIKVAKNSLMRKAIEEVYGKDVSIKLQNILTNQNSFLFTNINPYKVYLILEKNKIYTNAKEGDVAPEDVIIPSGNTGLTPGPILSKFGKLKIPTKIEEGSVWVAKDTVIVKKGEKFSKEAIEILNLLNIKPIPITLKLSYAFDGNIILENIVLDLDKIKEEIKDAFSKTLNFAINSKLPIKEVMPYLIQEAYNNSLKLLYNTVLPVKDSLMFNLQKAQSFAEIIYNKVKDKINL